MDESLKNPRQVAIYLSEKGVDVSQRTVYNHVRIGKLVKGNDGCFSPAAVDKYAATWLGKRTVEPENGQIGGELAEEKIKLVREQRIQREQQNALFRKEYIEREEMDRQVSKVVGGMKTDIENSFRAMAPARVEVAKEMGVEGLIEYDLKWIAVMYSRWEQNIERDT